ncbi:MAG: dolichyl-phosphate beta-glucosyltransferase [Armatimonadota bacterium]
MCEVNQDPFLSVVIPAYNEERRLPRSLEAIWAFVKCQPYTWEIVISDDGSRDATVKIARQFGEGKPVRILSDGENRGKGWAVRRGMLSARGHNVLFTDADLATPIEEVGKLLAAREEGYDVAIASRGLRDSVLEVREPWYRELLGRAGNILIQAVAVPGIWDTQCGFKLFSREACRDVFSRSVIDSICLDVELLFLARRMGYRIKEVPVRWRHDPDSRMRLVRESYRMLRDLARLRFVHRHVPRRSASCPAGTERTGGRL